MDLLTRRALTRALTSFLIVLVFGTVMVAIVGRLRGQGQAHASPSSSVSPSPTVSPASGQPDAWLAWVPGGIPARFGTAIRRVSGVAGTNTEKADVTWLTGVTAADGTPAGQPVAPLQIPLDTTAVGPSFASFLPQPERSLVDGLQQGEGVLSETGAALRGVGKGATLAFDTGASVTIVGTLPDVMMGGYELLVTRTTGLTIGVTHDRYILFEVKPGQNPNPVDLAARFQPYLPTDTKIDVVEVRRPFETRFLRPNDRELPPALLKVAFGEFAATPDPTTGALTVDPAWVQAHIRSETLPVLGTVTCHQKALVLLAKAMRRLEKAGNAGLITDHGTCYQPSIDPNDPEGALTALDFGGAIPLNPGVNRPGDVPDSLTQPTAVVVAMQKQGFGWGGIDAWPQGALFRYRVDPTATG